MCRKVDRETVASCNHQTDLQMVESEHVPVRNVLEPPSLTARMTCVSILGGLSALWGKYTFVGEDSIPGAHTQLHSWKTTLGLTVFYLASLPALRWFTNRFLSQSVDVKMLLRESMILYNAGQVLLNLWMVARFLDAVLLRGHPFIGGPVNLVDSGATYAVWVHYCDKYLEFFDTYFMVLRGKMDQVSFLHVYHHTSIAWAWWAAMYLYPGGDCYFGALVNSWIHVMMYSYYTLSLMKIHCPWKKYLTQAQLLQFVSVVGYSVVSVMRLPEEAKWNHYAAYAIQVFEMMSLFVLFLHFYRRTYRKKTKAIVKEDASTESTLQEQSSVSSQSSDEN